MTFRLAFLSLFALAAIADPPTMFPPVRGKHEMIGAANNLEVEAGYRMLTAGGNAVDAGVAAVLAAAVTEQSRFGLGGEMPLLVKMNGQPVAAISGIGTAPAKATLEFFAHREPEQWEQPNRMAPIPGEGIRAAIVPGAFDGLIVALSKFGTKSFAEVAAPALEYTDGFPIAEEFAGMLKSYKPMLELWPASKAFYYPNGTIPEKGDLVRMPSLGNTLRELCAVEKKTRGNRAKKLQAVRDLFYKGSIAKRIDAFSKENGGLLAYEDMASFQAVIDQPRTGTFRGYEVHKPGFWTQGPVMIQTLNILEGFDLKAMGHNSPEYLHTVIEAVKLAFADRDRYYGDPKFSHIPEEALLSKDAGTLRRKLIDPQHASMESRPSEIGAALTAAPATNSGAIVNDTTCVNVVDRDGNMFSATPSGAWLPSVIAGETGIPLTTRLQTFVTTPGHPNVLAPGKRPRVTLSPTLVTKDGKPFLVMSTPGGDNQDQALLQVLLNIIVFGMGPQEAVEAPRFQTEHFYTSFADHQFVPGRVNLENRIPKETAAALSALGHQINIATPWSNSSAPTVIMISADGVRHGAADPRRARFIFGR